MSRRIVTATLLATLVLTGLFTTSAAAAPTLQLPATMAAVGDSITQAASSAGSLGVDAPQNSWSTGTSSSVNSHYLRLLAAGAPISGANHNLSVSGAKMADLNAQMEAVVALPTGPDYLTVLIGGNDVCTDTAAGMTAVADFRAQLNAALATLKAGSPETSVYIVSIPDVYQLWSLFKNDFWARFIWSVGGVCQSLLANPTSTQQVDVQRREQVRQRNIDFNTQLEQACAAYAGCHYDGGAVFNTQFAKSDVSGDYFHPSVAGQAKLASVSWAAGYTWAASPPANVAPAAAFTSSCVDLTCTFTDTSTDSDGTIASRSWNFGDLGTSTDAIVSHTYAAAETYTVTLLVTDNGGASGSVSSSVRVTAPPATRPMWIVDLDGSPTSARNSWTATTTIVVEDAAGRLAGVTVTGSWSTGSGDTSCVTDATGTCSMKSSSLNKKTASVTFTVNDLTSPGWFYDSTQNTVPTSSITIQKP